MPCMQCENGKWKWGHRGDCIYDTKAECEEAHKGDHSKDPSEIRADDIEYWKRYWKEINQCL